MQCCSSIARLVYKDKSGVFGFSFGHKTGPVIYAIARLIYISL